MAYGRELLEVLTPKRLAGMFLVGFLAVGSMRVADRIEDVYDFFTPGVPDIDMPDALQNPPATIEVDSLRAVYEAVSSRLVYEKTEHVDGVGLEYDNRDIKALPSFFAGASVDQNIRGTVTAVVEFSEIDEDDFEITDEGRGLSVTLPKAKLSTAALDDDLIINFRYGLVNEAIEAKETEEVVRAIAEQELAGVALNNGLLEATEDEAGKSIQRFAAVILSAKGISVDADDIEVKFGDEQEPEHGSWR